MVFKNRTDAGQKLAQSLRTYQDQHPLIIALPRGGVPVAFQVAQTLKAPLDVLVVKKIGAPFDPEFGIGAIAPGGTVVLDQPTISALAVNKSTLDQLVELERWELERQQIEYRGSTDIPAVSGKIVILVDDGLATGVTAQAAIQALIAQNPTKIIVAVPVCSQEASSRLRSAIRSGIDDLVCLSMPSDFSSVGIWYRNFTQVTDEKVKGLLDKSKNWSDNYGR